MNYFFLSKTALFQGINEQEMKHMLSCLEARERTFSKNEIIFRAGDIVQDIGLIESGSVNIIVNFYWGDSQIFGHIAKGSIFAENYAAIPGKELLCDIVATEDSKILFLNLKKLLTMCQIGCLYHQRLIYNLLKIAAQKNLDLSSRMMHTASKSMRARILSYLSEQALIHSSTQFTIPYNRQQLADYLGVDRSALSKELSRMKKDGLIQYKKNYFELNDTAKAY